MWFWLLLFYSKTEIDLNCINCMLKDIFADERELCCRLRIHLNN